MTEILLLTLISLSLLGLFLYHTLGPREIWDFDQAEGGLSLLQKRRDRLLRALKDLEVEREMGALSDEEFTRLRRDFKREAVKAMKTVDRARQSRIRHVRGRRTSTPPSLAKRIDELVKQRKATH